MTDTHNHKPENNGQDAAEASDINVAPDDSTCASSSDCASVSDGGADEMQQQIEKLTEALEKEKTDYLFLRADFDNYRKRMLKDREELLRNAGEKVLRGLLPIVDDFERGLEATKDNADAVRQGMELIYHKLIKYLADNGVTPMESTGADFDPDFHEAIATIPAPSDDLKGKVLDTTQRGYMINDKVLRHAKVAVGE